MVASLGILIAALAHTIAALPPDVPYQAFWEVGEQSGFEVLAPLGRYIPQLSAGLDLVLRPTPSKATVSGVIISSHFASSGSSRGQHVVVVKADVWGTAEPVLVTVPGGVLVNDTRSNGGAGMCTTLGLLRPVRIFPGRPDAEFKVYLEPVPRDDDPFSRYAPGVPIRPWFEVQSDYDRRTNVPDAAFEWAHAVQLSSFLHRERVKFRDVDRSMIKDVVSEAFTEGFSAAVKATIMTSWKKYLDDVEGRGGPKYARTRPAKIDWDKATEQPHRAEGARATRAAELLQVNMTSFSSPEGAQGSVSSSKDRVLVALGGRKMALPASVQALVVAVVLILITGVAAKRAGVGISMTGANKEFHGGEEAKAEESHDDALASESMDDGLASAAVRPKRPTRRGRGVLRKKFQAMENPPGQGHARVDAADAVSIPGTASELFYPQAD